MRKYSNIAMGDLAADLTAGLLRLRKGYADATEALLRIIKSDRNFPLDFIIYRITGYRGERTVPPAEPLDGKTLIVDLQRLILDICDSFTLQVGAYAETVYDTDSLARRFNVSTKTVQRWRRRGLPARRLVFPDGKRRIAFLENSVRWFVANRHPQVARSTRFSQLTSEERQQIIRRAKRMATFAQCSLSDVVRRIASRTGRAVETVRYTIRKHDIEHPDHAVFPYFIAPLGEQDKMVIYRCFLRGVPVPSLADRYQRTRGSIYRIVNEMRARQLMKRPINYIFNPQFDLPDADKLILGASPDGDGNNVANPKAPSGLPAYLRALYDVPLLSADQERDIFRRYNYLKHKADRIRRDIDVNRVRTGILKQIETLLLKANGTKNLIVRSNLRLVVSIAKKHLGGVQSLFELVSDGNVSLMRAVEKFDYARGYRFSTYSSWAIIRNFARSVPKERYQLDRFSTGHDEVLDIAASLRIYDPNEVNLPELRESIDAMLSQLSPRERTILIDHYGLDDEGQVKTLGQLGQQLGLSKERVRQIEIGALQKLRKILHPRQADFLA